jgi:hypothetical protein
MYVCVYVCMYLMMHTHTLTHLHTHTHQEVMMGYPDALAVFANILAVDRTLLVLECARGMPGILTCADAC